MPNRDGTGPDGRGPIAGGRRRILRRVNSIKICTCPNCGYTEASQRGVPCTEKKCPKCGTLMKGPNCI